VLGFVKWRFALPLAAILLSLAARWVASTFHSIFKITVRGISVGQDEKLFIIRRRAEIARLRPRSHVH
jgi:hypothetical protein